MTHIQEHDPDAARTEILSELNHYVEMLDRQLQLQRLMQYTPYPKQLEFHVAGIDHPERLLMAGNQLGKTYSAAMEVAMHVTGIYPEWWEGRKFSKPVSAWCAGVTSESTRDNPQRLLLGVRREFGTGTIPADTIQDIQMARGVPDAVDSVTVQHISGRNSHIWFKSYEKGREKWQGQTLDFVWYDEEPPEEIYTEGLTRVNATAGMVFVTFTPLLGMSRVVTRYLQPSDDAAKHRHVVNMTLDDAPHMSESMKERILSQYPEYERDARTKGIPMLGSGRVYPIAEEKISFSLNDFGGGMPDYWATMGAVDFGDWDHPTSAVFIRWDRDRDTIYVTDSYRRSKEPLAVHAAAIRDRANGCYVAWPHDGLKHDRTAGRTIKDLYSDNGVKMLRERTMYESGDYSVEAGIADVLNRMQMGKLKIASHLGDIWEEFRLYHRKDGKIVKERDDLMDALRYAVMSIRHARAPSDMGRVIEVENMEEYHVL